MEEQRAVLQAPGARPLAISVNLRSRPSLLQLVGERMHQGLFAKIERGLSWPSCSLSSGRFRFR